MKNTRKLLILPFVATALVGCGKEEVDNRRVLTIEYVQAGFGDTPYEKVAEAFMAEHPDVRVDLVPNREMHSMCRDEIANGTCSDIMIYDRDVTHIRTWIMEGLVLDLTDLFNEPINDNGDTILSQLDDNGKKISKFKDKYYTIPEFYNINGFVYNATVFEILQKNNPNLKIPNTTKELKDACEILRNTEYSKGKKRSALVYCSSADGYLYYADQGWDVAYSGVAKMDDFFSYSSPEVYAPANVEGKIKGLDLQKEIFFESGYSLANSWALDNKQAQSMIFSSQAMMMLNGSWFENEMKSTFEANPNVKIKMFAIPEVSDNAGNVLHDKEFTCGEGKNRVVSAECNTNYFIPTKAKNIADAKEYLKFSARPEICELYTQYSNAVRPLKYNYSSANPKYANMSTFGKSVLDIANNYYLYVPTSSADIALGGATYRPQGYWFKSMIPGTGDYKKDLTGLSCATSDYDMVKSNLYKDWKARADGMFGK